MSIKHPKNFYFSINDNTEVVLIGGVWFKPFLSDVTDPLFVNELFSDSGIATGSVFVVKPFLFSPGWCTFDDNRLLLDEESTFLLQNCPGRHGNIIRFQTVFK
jgi:hypothetical protein